MIRLPTESNIQLSRYNAQRTTIAKNARKGYLGEENDMLLNEQQCIKCRLGRPQLSHLVSLNYFNFRLPSSLKSLIREQFFSSDKTEKVWIKHKSCLKMTHKTTTHKTCTNKHEKTTINRNIQEIQPTLHETPPSPSPRPQKCVILNLTKNKIRCSTLHEICQNCKWNSKKQTQR